MPPPSHAAGGKQDCPFEGGEVPGTRLLERGGWGSACPWMLLSST